MTTLGSIRLRRSLRLGKLLGPLKNLKAFCEGHEGSDPWHNCQSKSAHLE